jgi:hypothetical protein
MVDRKFYFAGGRAIKEIIPGQAPAIQPFPHIHSAKLYPVSSLLPTE